MAEILSQSQIDALLSGLNSGEMDIKEMDTASDKKIKEYDFRSPKKITKETIKLLNGVYENYCRNISSHFSAMLRFLCDISVEEIEESRFHEFNNALDDYVLMGLIDVKFNNKAIEENQVLMQISKSLSFLIIDRLMGGTGEGYNYDRDYTDIELSILSNLFKQIVPKMQSSWESTVDIETIFDKIETNSRFIQSINYNDTVVIIVLKVEVRQTVGQITICIPEAILDEIYKKSDSSNRNSKKKNSEANAEQERESIMSSLKDSRLNVSGILGRAEVTLNDILNIDIGDVLILDSDVNSSVEVNIEGEKWFEGKWGVKKNKSVIKINGIIH